MQYIVLGGGISPESEVSKRSAAAVQSALEALGHTVTLIDPKTTPADTIMNAAKGSDGVFPILHGLGGEDGSIQQQLEAHHIPYFGPSFRSCQTTYDKVIFKKILEENAISTPKWNEITSEQLADEPLAQAPFVLKPIDGGSSIDTFIIRTLPFDPAPLQEALGRYGSMLIEELIIGSEITVGILEDTALPVVEIIPPQDKEFDYENKYNGETAELCPPQNVSVELQAKAQALALEVHNATACRHISRTDILIDEQGELYVIDTNTIPGLTSQSLYPKAAAAAGYDWTALVRRFTEVL
jgi:D-alanine-D-alanine ligase